MSLSGSILVNLRASESGTLPVSGGLTALTTWEGLLTDGTTANRADLAHKSLHTIAGVGNSDIDLRALLEVGGVAMTTLTEVVALVLENAGTGLLSIKPSASNGWLGLLADATDVLKLQPGAKILLWAPGDGLYPVGALTKSINVANAAATSAVLTLTLIGRSA